MKKLKVIEYALLALSAVVFVIAVATITGVESATLDLYMGWAYALIAVAIAATLGFPLVKAFKNKKSLIKLLVTIAAVIVVFGGAYLLAPGKPIEMNAQVSPSDFKFADTALYIAYLFVVAAIAALIWGGVRKAIKK